jgi:hypothetical protein
MMDLFYSGLSTTMQLRKLTKEVKKRLNVSSNDVKGKFKLVLRSGPMETLLSNCCLFLIPHVAKKGFMQGIGEPDKLMELIHEHKMEKSVISYCYHGKIESVSKRMIKECTNQIETLISIIDPRLIVLLGEEACYVFLSRKSKIEDHHGELVRSHNGIPLILTYHPGYYITHSAYEDKRYKENIMNHDWSIIKEYYDKRIT